MVDLFIGNNCIAPKLLLIFAFMAAIGFPPETVASRCVSYQGTGLPRLLVPTANKWPDPFHQNRFVANVDLSFVQKVLYIP